MFLLMIFLLIFFPFHLWFIYISLITCKLPFLHWSTGPVYIEIYCIWYPFIYVRHYFFVLFLTPRSSYVQICSSLVCFFFPLTANEFRGLQCQAYVPSPITSCLYLNTAYPQCSQGSQHLISLHYITLCGKVIILPITIFCYYYPYKTGCYIRN